MSHYLQLTLRFAVSFDWCIHAPQTATPTFHHWRIHLYHIDHGQEAYTPNVYVTFNLFIVGFGVLCWRTDFFYFGVYSYRPIYSSVFESSVFTAKFLT